MLSARQALPHHLSLLPGPATHSSSFCPVSVSEIANFCQHSSEMQACSFLPASPLSFSYPFVCLPQWYWALCASYFNTWMWRGKIWFPMSRNLEPHMKGQTSKPMCIKPCNSRAVKTQLWRSSCLDLDLSSIVKSCCDVGQIILFTSVSSSVKW